MIDINQKICSGCRQTKKTTEFYKRGDSKDKTRSRCKECLDTAFRKRYADNSELKVIRATRYQKYKDIHRNNVLKWHYNITLEQYNEMLKAQNYACAICNRNEKEFSRRLGVDHCHQTNVVRQLLCGGCNTGLGGFQDSEELLLAAVKYIQNHKKFKLVKGVK